MFSLWNSEKWQKVSVASNNVVVRAVDTDVLIIALANMEKIPNSSKWLVLNKGSQK